MKNDSYLILIMLSFIIIFSGYTIGDTIDYQKQLDLKFANTCVPINHTDTFCFNYTTSLLTTR